MENSVATASVNLFGIKRRKYTHKAFRGLQELSKKIKTLAENSPEDVHSILLYPRIDSPSVFADLCNRLGWYLPAGSFDTCNVHILGKDTIASESTPPGAQKEFQTDQLSIQFHSSSKAFCIAKAVDSILVWDKSNRLDTVTLPHIDNVNIVDPGYYSTIEPGTWSRVTNSIRHSRKDYSRENYQSLEQSFQETNVSYVFGTGPSLDNVFELDIPTDALSIICNSIVRDDELLAHLQPDVLVFADPVFHFGPSRYADRFREDVVDTLRQYDCTAIIPKKFHSLFVGNYPELSDRIVSLESTSISEFIFPTHERLEVKATSNIMTLFMLPIAASLTEEIRIVGADGRKDNESYFWEHSDTGQYDDELMRTVAETHPAFFRDRVYEDYYDEHVKKLTELIEYSESQGIDIHSVTNSYIPALSERRVDPQRLDTE
jgi:DNA-binding ferritin-like protein (Dps family)